MNLAFLLSMRHYGVVFSGPMYDLLGAEYEGPGSLDSMQDVLRAVAAPTVGGVVVTGLRFLAGGFAGDPPSVNPTKQEDGNSRTPAAAKPALKAVAAAVTLGSGASLGPEGPSVEIGANVAKGVAAAAPAMSSRHLGKAVDIRLTSG